MKTVKTTCFRDCWDACGMIATVEGEGADERVTRLEGDPDNPYTRGFLCSRMKDFHKINYSSERILRPRLKRNGVWEEVSWDDALDLCADRLKQIIAESGPLSILNYMGAGTFGVTRLIANRFFNLLGGVTTASGSLCDAAGEEGQIVDFGHQWAHDPLDHLNSRFIIVWGRNPSHSNVHLVPILKEAREQGAKIVIIDPIRIEVAQQADLHIQPRPGTDIYLALAMGRVILNEGLADSRFIAEHADGFDRYKALVEEWTPERAAEKCGLTAEAVTHLARLYATTKPAAILAGMGVQYYRHGGATMRAIDALGAITGNLGIAGGGVSFDFSSRSSFDYKSWMAAEQIKESRSIPRPQLAAGLRNLACSSSPIHSAWFIAANPVTQTPDSRGVLKALERIEFKVTVTPFDSDTARASDLILPACTFFEKEDVRGSYWQPRVGYMNKAVEPYGDSLPETEIFRRLAERMGLRNEMAGDWLDKALAPLTNAGVARNHLREQGGGRSPLVPVVPFEGGRFHTRSERFNFLGSLPEICDGNTPDFPYTLLTPKAKSWHNSSLWAKDHPTIPTTYVNPDSGEPDGIVVCIESPTGVLRVMIKHNADVRPGVVMIYQGSNVDLGGGVNILTTDMLSDLGDNACFGETRVRVVTNEQACGCR